MSEHEHEWGLTQQGSRCTICQVRRFHGPRATIIAPQGSCFLDFDADGLHLRIASCLSRDTFIGESLKKYDETGDDQYKPHIQNTSALFHVEPGEAIEWMKKKDNRYTFSKNFIYLILNGGDVPALRNAAVGAGLQMNEKEVKFLLDRWLERASGFDAWRKSLIEEAENKGYLDMPDGRRRRFYGLKKRRVAKKKPDPHADRYWEADHDTVKEIYNAPLICTEVSFMNPRVYAVWQMLPGTGYKLVLYEHDGFMIEGPSEKAKIMFDRVIKTCDPKHVIDAVRTLYVPFTGKVGTCWAELK